MGNIVNRVFDSSGPEGKVRGTPQQIIEKYLILARDAQLSNDRVAAENFQQHAEHYTRMLGEAQREMAAEQESRRDGGQNNGSNGLYGGQGGGQIGFGQTSYRDRPRDEPDQPRAVQPLDLVDDGDDSGLVETPEARAGQDLPRSDAPRSDPPRNEQRERREDRPRFQDRRPPRQPAPEQPAPAAETAAEPATEANAPQADAPAAVLPRSPMMPSFAPPEPETDTAAPKPRRPRAPRKPKAASEAAPEPAGED